MTPPSFFFNVPATTEIYTLSLHDALPICRHISSVRSVREVVTAWQIEKFVRLFSIRDGFEVFVGVQIHGDDDVKSSARSEEHTSELQSHSDLVCRLLLEKKKMKIYNNWL